MTTPLKQDEQTTTLQGERLVKLPHGVSLYDLTTHVDERGAVCEMFDFRWGWSDAPLVFAYHFTVRPGIVKGWGMHKLHEDRYCLIFGELKVVLYDDRPESPTRGLLSEIFLSEYRRQLINIPIGIWHADHNVGDKDALVVNFPTTAYDHVQPDKYRLPLDNDIIPYSFGSIRGGG
jgi:dTDP-4-dehydrorhamnose 3,5-epimerase